MKTTFNAETAEAAEKKPQGILGDLCVLCVKRGVVQLEPVDGGRTL
jgi:hypothetical protein